MQVEGHWEQGSAEEDESTRNTGEQEVGIDIKTQEDITTKQEITKAKTQTMTNSILQSWAQYVIAESQNTGLLTASNQFLKAVMTTWMKSFLTPNMMVSSTLTKSSSCLKPNQLWTVLLIYISTGIWNCFGRLMMSPCWRGRLIREHLDVSPLRVWTKSRIRHLTCWHFQQGICMFIFWRRSKFNICSLCALTALVRNSVFCTY